MENIIVDGWGYSMTIVSFAKIIGRTPKKVRCVMIKSNEVGDGFLTGKAYPLPDEVISKPFLLSVRQNKDGSEYYKGSYPFCAKDINDNDESKRMGYFRIYDSDGCYFNHCD